MVTIPTGTWVDNNVDAGELRKSLGAALVIPAGATAPRPGRLIGPGAPLTVSPTSPATMSVLVKAGKAHTYRSAAYGPILGLGPDGDVTVPIVAPGSGSQWYRVYLAQRDTTPPAIDADSLAVVDVIAGTAAASPTKPSLPAGALLLGEVLVPAGASSITAGMVTDLPTYTAPRGGILPVASQAERVALQAAGTVWATLEVLELDTGRRLLHDGTRFRHEGDRVLVNNTAQRDALVAYAGLRALDTSTGVEYRYTTAWDDVVSGPPPRIDVRQSTAQPFGGLFPVPWDQVITGQTSPALDGANSNEWFTFDYPGRRILVKRAGLYFIEAEITTNDGTTSQYLKLVKVPTTNVQGDTISQAGGSANYGMTRTSTTVRLAAGEYVGVWFSTAASVRQDDPVLGLRSHLSITRLAA